MEVTQRYTLPTLVTLLTLSCRGTQQAVATTKSEMCAPHFKDDIAGLKNGRF